MISIEKMQEITEFYQAFLQTICRINADGKSSAMQKKRQLLQWLAARQKAPGLRAYCKNEIVSMFPEVESCSPEVLERRIRTLSENCRCILAQMQAPAVRRYA